jgi:hypothetical protein
MKATMHIVYADGVFSEAMVATTETCARATSPFASRVAAGARRAAEVNWSSQR